MSLTDEKKMWGSREFWGISYHFDPMWTLTDSQRTIQKNLIELCRTTMRPHSIKIDQTYDFPRNNMNALASQGLLSLTVPKELGGMGESHRCAVMVVETIARYGCASTAMVYVMHLGAVACLAARHHNNEHFKDLLRRVDKDRMVGTLVASDPATGSHVWYHLSSKCWQLPDGKFQMLKFGAWVTSAGFADWYVVQTVSPDFHGNYKNMSDFLVYKDEVRANTEDWAALGLHGNQSGPMIAEGIFTPERLIGPIGDGQPCIDELIDPWFLMGSGACWNGVAIGAIDIARKHTMSKTHADTGMRVCDYPTIQDYIGEAICDTNACRLMTFSVADALDKATNDCDWSIHADVSHIPRTVLGHWTYQVKFSAAKNVTAVVDKMLHACGGSGFKWDLGLERLLRDAKAGWVMGPSNEVLRQIISKIALAGPNTYDYWGQKPDKRIIRQEVKKMTKAQKSSLAHDLLWEVSAEESATGKPDVDKFDFDNPLAVRKPEIASTPKRGLSADVTTALKLKAKRILTKDKRVMVFYFSLPAGATNTGCFPGQYVQIAVPENDKKALRFLSPTSKPDGATLDIVMRFENQGILSQFMKNLDVGTSVEFLGPCGGIEYKPNTFSSLTFICGGIGITPAYQIIQSICLNPGDRTKVLLLYQARNSDEMIMKPELDAFCSMRENQIRAQYVLQDADGTWDEAEGHVDAAFLERALADAPPEGANHKFVLCGGAHMVLCCLDAIYQMRYSSEDIFIYGANASEQIRAIFGRNAKLFSQ